MKKFTKKALALLMAAVMLLSLAACGGKKDDTQKEDTQKEDTSKPGTPSTGDDKPDPAKTYKKEIRIGQQQDITDFTRYTNNTIACFQTCNAVFNGLVNLDLEGKASPELATEWSSNEDSSEWTFKLRQDVKFHDGGAFTAEDVKFTWDYFSNLENEGTKVRPAGYEMVKEIVVVDPYTVTFKMNSSCVEWLAFAYQDILSKEAVTKLGVLEGGKIGTGAYKYDTFEPGISWSIVRNDDFWGEKGITERFTFVVLSDNSSRALALQSGDIDVMYEGNVSDIAPMMSDPNYKVYDSDGKGVVYLGINNQSKYGSNVIVRQALAKAIDREAIVLACYEGIGASACASFIPPTAPGYFETECHEYDPAAAQKLLKDNGLEGITLQMYVFAKYLPVAQVIQANLKEIGITLNIEERQQSGFSSGIKKDGGYDMFINVVSPNNSLCTAFQTVLHSTYNATGCNYFNEEFDKRIDAAYASKNYDELTERFNSMLIDVNKEVPAVPLATVKLFAVGPASFGGLDMRPVGYDVDWTYCYIEE